MIETPMGLRCFGIQIAKPVSKSAKIHLSKSMGGSDEFCSPEDNFSHQRLTETPFSTLTDKKHRT